MKVLALFPHSSIRTREDEHSVAPLPRTPPTSLAAARRPSAPVATAATVCFVAGALLAVPGFVENKAAYLSLAALAISLGFVLGDVSRMRLEGITAMTTYSISPVAVAVCNTIAILSAIHQAGIYFLLNLGGPSACHAPCACRSIRRSSLPRASAAPVGRPPAIVAKLRSADDRALVRWDW